jgi:predicted AAA+ superfamily ATPase
LERLITKKLLHWKNQEHRKPLMLRGARQVGKTWSLMDFGRQYFNGSVHLVDLEKHPDWHRLFDRNLEASRICSDLEILLNASIVPGRDLLFFDEIQACPRAVMALRYFYEEMPQLHVIAAGSLLEFVMRDIVFPAGRIHMLHMHPMGFIEFLRATGKSKAAESLLDVPQKLSDTVHEALLEELRRYLFIGGMPECVLRYSETGSMRDAFEVQADLVIGFRQDFSKYAPLADKKCMNAVLASTAQNVGRQVKYARMAEGFSNPTIKKAFDLLQQARLVRKVGSVNPPAIPFGASVSEKQFKAVLVDIGLMQHLCGMPVDAEFQKKDLLSIHEGAMAEQFVGQEFLAAGQSELFYWQRGNKSSTAEVDYILAREGRVSPVEVKSGPSGRLKSLHLFLKQYNDSLRGYVLSCAPYAELPDQKLVFLPLYFAHALASAEQGD